uniref:Uncharacterized protein n=1 Tax=Crocodylus porosus TaxID=8502 RepID=A0A7M4FU54_CROPO
VAFGSGTLQCVHRAGLSGALATVINTQCKVAPVLAHKHSCPNVPGMHFHVFATDFLHNAQTLGVTITSTCCSIYKSFLSSFIPPSCSRTSPNTKYRYFSFKVSFAPVG